MAPAYDESRATYALTRRQDPRLAAVIERALGDARTVVNAVEPSAVMRAQRPDGAAPALAAYAEDLPLEDDSVDAALATLAVHHWDDQRRGLAEMTRVARRRVVIFTFDPDQAGSFWLVRDYLPEIAKFDGRRFLT